MDLTLDYNIELFPLKTGQAFALALASSLVRGAPGQTAAGGDEEDKDKDVWRPDGKGRRGLEEDYEYVMYGKVRCPSIHTGSRRSVWYSARRSRSWPRGPAAVADVTGS